MKFFLLKNILFALVLGSLALLTQPTQSFADDLIFEKDKSIPLVTVAVVFRGGSSIDPIRKGGTTDLMAKLLLRGTRNKTKAQIDLLLDQLGGVLTIETKTEHWILQGSVLSKNIKPFIELITEILTAPSFQASEFTKLKSEHLAHFNNLMDQDQAVLKLRFQQEFFKGHPFARPSFGTLSEVKGIQLSDVASFYKNTLPLQGNLILAVGDASASDIDPLQSALRRTFPQAAHFSDFKTQPFKHLQPRVVIFDKPDRTQTQIMIGHVGVAATSPDLDALMLANHAFGGDSFQARLMKELRVKRGWTYGAKSQIKLATQPHTWTTYFFPKSADTAPAIKEALKMIADFQKQGLSQDEFLFAQSALVNGAGFSFNTASKRLENKLLEKLFGLPEGFQQNQGERLKLLTLAQVNQAIQKAVKPDQLFIGVVGTASRIQKPLAEALGVSESTIQVKNYRE